MDLSQCQAAKGHCPGGKYPDGGEAFMPPCTQQWQVNLWQSIRMTFLLWRPCTHTSCPIGISTVLGPQGVHQSCLVAVRTGDPWLPTTLISLVLTSKTAPCAMTALGRGYVATLPTRAPLLILPPALKRRGSPRLQGLCSHLAHKWATFDFVPRSQAEGIPEAAGVM